MMKHRAVVHLVAAGVLLVSLLSGLTRSQTSEPPTGGPDSAWPGDEQPPPEDRRVYVLRIEGMISDVMLASLQRRMAEAEANGVDVVVLEMDTYGGLVMSALEICRYIKNLDVRTVAWVHDKAYSAGSMISVACDRIIMSGRSTIGDCAPIVPGRSLAETERAKAAAPVLEEFRDSARRNGYPEVLCEAMVRLGPAVYQIQRVAAGDPDPGDGERAPTGEIRYVWANHLPRYGLTMREQDRGSDNPPAPDASSQQERERFPFGIDVNGPGDAASSAAPPGRTRAQTDAGAGEAPAREPPRQGDDAEPARSEHPLRVEGEWRIAQRVNPPDTLLTLTQNEAVSYGFARRVIKDDAALAAYLGVPERQLNRLAISWSEKLANWLTSPAVRSVLMIVLMLGGYMELQSPGLGLPGAAAGTALVLLVGAPYLAGMADVADVLLIAAGLVLIGVEMFVLPGFGIAGITGIAALLGGLLMTFIQSEPGPGWLPALQGTRDMLEHGLLAILAAMVGTSIGFYFLTRYYGSIPVLNRLVLQTEQIDQGAGAPVPASGEPPTETPEQFGLKAGDTGRAITGLHPVGRVEFEGEVLDVVTPGGWVEAGTRVRIIEIHGNRIVVEED